MFKRKVTCCIYVKSCPSVARKTETTLRGSGNTKALEPSDKLCSSTKKELHPMSIGAHQQPPDRLCEKATQHARHHEVVEEF